jgi:hypothetical protein
LKLESLRIKAQQAGTAPCSAVLSHEGRQRGNSRGDLPLNDEELKEFRISHDECAACFCDVARLIRKIEPGERVRRLLLERLDCRSRGDLSALWSLGHIHAAALKRLLVRFPGQDQQVSGGRQNALASILGVWAALGGLASRARVERSRTALCGGPVLPHVAGRPRDPQHSMTAKMKALRPEFVYPAFLAARQTASARS